MPEEILEKFFYPGSLAIIGATRTPGFGFGIPAFLKRQGWLERTYLVNPKGGEIEGRKVYTSIEELPEGIDLAVVMVRAELVPEVLAELGRKGINLPSGNTLTEDQIRYVAGTVESAKR